MREQRRTWGRGGRERYVDFLQYILVRINFLILLRPQHHVTGTRPEPHTITSSSRRDTTASSQGTSGIPQLDYNDTMAAFSTSPATMPGFVSLLSLVYMVIWFYLSFLSIYRLYCLQSRFHPFLDSFFQQYK